MRGQCTESVVLQAGPLHRATSGLLSHSAGTIGTAVHDRVSFKRQQLHNFRLSKISMNVYAEQYRKAEEHLFKV